MCAQATKRKCEGKKRRSESMIRLDTEQTYIHESKKRMIPVRKKNGHDRCCTWTIGVLSYGDEGVPYGERD